MKKLLLFAAACISSAVAAQDVAVDPPYGCPNTTHNVTVEVTNNLVNIPNGFTYTIELEVKKSDGTVLKSFNQDYNTGFAQGTTQDFLLDDVPFEGPMVLDIEGSITALSQTYSLNSEYIVQNPPDLTIAESAGQISTVTDFEGYNVQFFIYGTFDYETEDGEFTPEASGEYTAKAVNHVTSVANGASSCLSENFSNTITITITALEEAKDISVSVYPNPMVSSVTISTSTLTALTYELSDVNGAVVRSSTFNGVGNINAEGLNSGSYLLVIKNNKNEKVATYKMVK